MSINETQNWVKENFERETEKLGLEFGLAMLLGQAGQLSDAVIHRKKDAEEQEFAHVMFVLINLANVLEIDMEQAFDQHIMQKDLADLFKRLEDYYQK